MPESDRFGEAPHPRCTYELFGHHDAEQLLLDAYRSGRLPQSIILGGPEGIGKATLAWRFARFLLANPDPLRETVTSAQSLAVSPDHPAAHRVEALSDGDIFLLRREWNATSKRHFTEIRIDDVRKMIGRFHQSSGNSGWRTAIIDCVEDLNNSSANSLLKLIEEPPPRSLFLFVANKPARVLATIRSRSRMVHMAHLSQTDAMAAVRALGGAWSMYGDAELERAAIRGGGSVRETLAMLESDSGVLDDFDAIMAQLPRIDWHATHALVEALAARTRTEDFETVMTAVFDWLSQQVRVRAGDPQQIASLAQLAELWEKIATSARQVEAINLDRRPFLLTMFGDLAEVAASSGN
ncbi:MAG: DNA polymerase III subunit delta' [Hyphomicrobiales bacterium]|nr:DNA polymerase III subunit delta' [Hyphomicrobiales bacterium]